MAKCEKDNKELSYYIKYGFYGKEMHKYDFCQGEKCQKIADELWEKSKIYVQRTEMHWEQISL